MRQTILKLYELNNIKNIKTNEEKWKGTIDEIIITVKDTNKSLSILYRQKVKNR